MAKREVIFDTDPLLRKKSRAVTVFDNKLATLLDDMAETMYFKDGAGLAGPQISVLRRVIVIDDGNGLREFVNPVILESESFEVKAEGCLSIPKRYGYVSRPNKVKIEYYDRNGKHYTETVEGFAARIISHEVDHLNGILFTDKTESEPEQCE